MSSSNRPSDSPPDNRIQIRLATRDDREAIGRVRHEVYARELHQHSENPEGRLSDPLDETNLFLVASVGGELAGFVSLTPPGAAYSIDKYLSRKQLPFRIDAGLFEVRLLTTVSRFRQCEVGGQVCGLLAYAALRWIDVQGGTRVVAIGRREVLGLYRKFGLQALGVPITSGAVHFELMTATMPELAPARERYQGLIHYLESKADWRLAVPYRADDVCFHGGASFQAIGDEFDQLGRADLIIRADVLDAWFPAAPKVVDAVRERFAWLLQTSPPADGAGLVRAITRARGVDQDALVLGAGSSDLVFRSLGRWLTAAARVLLLEPTYGEYAHVCENVVKCRLDHLKLERADGYVVPPQALQAAIAGAEYDLVILVNPNNPTGQMISRRDLECVLSAAPPRTRFLIDEAYLDYVGAGESLEDFACRSKNVFVLKSMSKVYALSGARVGYLCGPPEEIRALRRLTPPWIVSLPAQVAAVHALAAPQYYAERYQETHFMRERLMEGLWAICPGVEVIAGVANFVLCHFPNDRPDAATLVSHCQSRGLFVRPVGGRGTAMGTRAVRIAVRSESENERMLEVLSMALEETSSVQVH